MAEKEIALKNKRIACLEEYCNKLETKLLSGAPIDKEELHALKAKV